MIILLHKIFKFTSFGIHIFFPQLIFFYLIVESTESNQSNEPKSMKSNVTSKFHM